MANGAEGFTAGPHSQVEKKKKGRRRVRVALLTVSSILLLANPCDRLFVELRLKGSRPKCVMVTSRKRCQLLLVLVARENGKIHHMKVVRFCGDTSVTFGTFTRSEGFEWRRNRYGSDKWEMAVAMEAMIEHRKTQVPEMKEFLVPNILGVNLKKKAEDRSPGFETDRFGSEGNGGDVNKPTRLIENVQKNLSDVLENDLASRAGIGISSKAEDEEDVIEMASERHRDKGSEKQSSYLLQPVLKPVARPIEGSPTENPILKALFGGGNPTSNKIYNWVSGDRPSTNNCHPFKKTELSQDIVNDATPIQVPKSLTKHRRTSPSPQSRNDTKSSDALKENNEPCANRDSTSAAPAKTVTSNKTKSSQDKENKSVTPDDVLKQTLSKVSSAKGKISSLSSLKRIGYVNSEKLMKLRALVDNAIKNHKVYSMTGCYNSVRNALKQRGWIEKIDSDIKGKRRHNRFEEIGIYDAAFQFVQKYPTLAAMRYSIQTNSGFSHNDQINYSGQGEAEIINRMLRNINEDLCWLSRPYPYYCWKDIGKFDLVNRLPKAYFSNKIGLCNSLQHIQWFFEPGVCSTQYPRTYNMSQKDEYEAFKDDFRMTACIGLLKWLTINYRSGGERAVRSADGKVDACIVDFALKRCTEYVKYREHEDIDLPDGVTVWEYQWDHFITQYYKVINDGHLLKECKSDPSIQVYVTNALAMLNLIKAYWPQINIDGYLNYWVVKPGGRCCGNGIVIKNNLDQILMMVNPSATRETRYVVQKYIERPLLIYNTKFDIRQWFLVTSVYPLTVWMYRESYLRFCSQPFSLKNTHESIHLCNNAVQRRYKNSKRDRSLPDENMWDCYTFQTYLKSIGHPDAWDKYIYPGMKEGFIGALLASQDTMERRKNCFELYGADFMISDTLTDGPWLIEINSNPAMDSSTSVTARMCPQVLEDIVKVVIDRRDDKHASTGAFEMVFQQHCPPVPPYLGMSLSIKGQKVHRMNPPGDSKSFGKKSKNPNSSGKFLQSETEDSLSEDPNELRSEYSCHVRKSGDFLGQARSEKGLPAPSLSSEMLEGLKKDILCAKLSIRLIHRDRERDMARRASEMIKVEEFLRGKGVVKQKNSKVCNMENLKEIIPEDIEITYGDDVIEIVAPKSISCFDATHREEEEANDSVQRNLSGKAENDGNRKTESVRSIDNVSPEEFLTESENEITKPKISCITELSPESMRRAAIMEEVHPTCYKRCDENGVTVLEAESSEREQDDNAEDKPGSSDAGKYIIKQEIQKKNVSVRKTSWKTNNSSRLDYKRRWKFCKRKKVDYVQKNIEDLRVMQERPRLAHKSSRIKNIPPAYRKIAPVSKSILDAGTTDYEGIYREELLKMLHSMNSKTFVQQLCGRKGKYWNRYLEIKRGGEAKTVPSEAEVFKREGKIWKSKSQTKSEEEKFEVPQVCNEIADQLSLQKTQSRKSLCPLARQSCPNFVDKEISQGEGPVRGKYEIPPSEKGSCTDWKANIETARRACQDILAKLREFNESNSKVRLQEALREKKDVDEPLNVYPKSKCMRKHLTNGAEPGCLRPGLGGGRRKKKEQVYVSVGPPGFDSSLAINSENGAVRKVDRTLPKIHRWALVNDSCLKSSALFGFRRA